MFSPDLPCLHCVSVAKSQFPHLAALRQLDVDLCSMKNIFFARGSGFSRSLITSDFDLKLMKKKTLNWFISAGFDENPRSSLPSMRTWLLPLILTEKPF